MSDGYSAWIGRSEEIEEYLDLAPARAAAAMLDLDAGQFQMGSALPPLWHWFYFLPRVRQSELDVDGHPKRGGFMPPIDLPRRMFAGARIQFHRPLRLGEPARRRAEILSVSEKAGRSGRLAFVTVSHKITQAEELCIEEQQDIVYRDRGPAIVSVPIQDWEPPPAETWSQVVQPDPILLFRFSALTFNAHRIHYDRDYARQQEGYPGLVVHGPLTAVLLMELVRNRTRAAEVTAFSFRGQAPLFDLGPFRLLGRQNGSCVELQAQGPDGQMALIATAELIAQA